MKRLTSVFFYPLFRFLLLDGRLCSFFVASSAFSAAMLVRDEATAVQLLPTRKEPAAASIGFSTVGGYVEFFVLFSSSLFSSPFSLLLLLSRT